MSQASRVVERCLEVSPSLEPFDRETHATELARRVPLGTTLSLFAELTPGRPAALSQWGDISFGELDRKANQLVRALRDCGMQRGDGFAVLLRNRVEVVIAQTACLRSGFRVTPINFHLKPDEVAYIVADSDAKAFIGEVELAESAEAAGRSPALRLCLSVGGEIPGFDDFHETLTGFSSDALSDPVFSYSMLYTSGTTGRPKGVYRPNREALAPEFEGTTADYQPHSDCHLLTGPAYHAAPLMYLSRALVSGVPTVMMDKWYAEKTLELIHSYRVTHTHMVPTMFHRLLRLPDEARSRYDVSSLKSVVHGAAPCPVEVKRSMIEWLGPIVWEYYAATEGSNGFLVGSEEWLEKPGTVGRPGPDFDNKILDEQGNELPPGEVGTIFMRSPEKDRFSYYKDDAKTDGAYSGEYFTLGDHGYFDEDGYLFLTGRSAELIISGGVNIYPAEVDQRLLQHAAIVDVCTVGVPNEEWGEEVKAVVQLGPGHHPTEELDREIIDFARAGLAHYKCPRSITYVEGLPRLDSGKLQRAKVRAMFCDSGES